MKARFVNENIEFQRGVEAKKTLKIGKRRLPEIGEKIQIYNAIDDEYWNGIVSDIDDDIISAEIIELQNAYYPLILMRNLMNG